MMLVRILRVSVARRILPWRHLGISSKNIRHAQISCRSWKRITIVYYHFFKGCLILRDIHKRRSMRFQVSPRGL